MIKFFRNIRRQLLGEGKTTKYVKYAIGEVLLVMIGILLALQVNNWNEARKESILELEYLKEIKTDLENDLPHVERRVRAILRKISLFHKIDSTYRLHELMETHDVSLDNIRLIQIFNRGALTRLTTGSYTALTTNTSAGLLKNTELLKSIQYLYEMRYPANQSIYEDLKRREEYLGWKYAKEYKNSNIQDFFIDNPDSEEVLADFNFYYRQQGLMYLHTLDNRDLIIKLIEDINTELEQRK
jgi:hypothetical protein